ncbi:hypothetical protein [Paraburkholderia caballeronis]|nr:hypothetical protein [Paraburkholderia caballeronis]TDV06032.1 hypothetical protein C7408_12413 [Paraburkholderia caballeronis]TDV09572.1 hypothetical protein C7406_12613 [Paraburkholderia caballeronis]TDV21637.1 hypothetical protein C7404_12113 [Paraburkholderia caballeronis]
MRITNDNALLASCERVHRLMTRVAAFGLFVLVGAVWYVAFVIGVTR